ncbi:uncharacterized protein LOC130656063 isoform X2 [Hydractinia symbiolongicarpus]|uniref:uncharacterized protein LOC130656063 isoform X2 n=1 Tax=Hydractinia symbiolongicarpus TaxID=13093 RepID=UPI00254F340F|nr:uncharacterized protein LOC130656063 isoform X2 [Hydractinia symbiolongicarpus]
MAPRTVDIIRNFTLIISFFLSSAGALLTVFTRNMEILLSLRRQQQIALHNATQDQNSLIRKIQKCKKRRTDLWWKNLIGGKLPEEEWYRNIRMDYPTFMNIVDKICVNVEPAHNLFRVDTLSAEKELQWYYTT